MPWFQRPVGFGTGPLLPAVPLDGTQTVTGLRELERQTRFQGVQRHVAAQATAAAGPESARTRRYKGPYLAQLRSEVLRQAPKPWDNFVLHDGSFSRAFNVPDSLKMLHDRLDENIVFFLVNYCYIAAAVLLIVGSLYPKAIIGLAILAATAVLNLRLSQSASGAVSEDLQTLQSFSWLAAVLAVLWSRCLLALSKWSLWTSAAVLLHGSLRRTAGELQLGQAAGPGVPFNDFWSDRPTHPDRWRLAREVWRVGSDYAAYGSWHALAWLQHQWHGLRAAIFQLQQKRLRRSIPETFLD